MSVLAEAISVIVPVATLNAKYPGGLRRYKADCPNRAFCCDGQLTRVGFMSPADVRAFTDQLEAAGFVLLRDGNFEDLAIVDQIVGPTAPCNWLEGGRHADGYSAVWLTGSEAGEMAVPDGWAPAQSQRMVLVRNEEVSERLLALGQKDDVGVFLDFSTGKEVYVGRPRIRKRKDVERDPER